MSHSNAHTNIRYRMRHIRVISLRRLSTTEIPALFFTLHSLAPRSRLIYRSERHAPSRNPTWKKISSNQLRDIECSFESQFILRVWAEDSSKERLMLEWNVDLNELVGIENHRIGVVTSSNLVLFGLRNTGKSSLLFTDRTLVEGLRVVSHDTGLFANKLILSNYSRLRCNILLYVYRLCLDSISHREQGFWSTFIG